MPNRMLRDWTRSDKIKLIGVHAERFFTRLIMKVDDYGCLYADATLLKADLFPYLMDKIREADLLRWMAECHKAGLIVLYENSGKKYVHILEFRQRLDKSRSKYPLPSETDFPEVVNGFPGEPEREVEPEKKLNIGPDGQACNKEILDKGGKKIFVPPTLVEAQAYIINCKGNSKLPNSWPEHRCMNAGADFFLHYKANGWVQGRGKPLKDWKAAADKWIVNELKGTFAPPQRPAPAAKAIPAVPPAPTLSKQEDEINYLYDRYLEGHCTIISIETTQYDYLKRIGAIQFSEDDRAHIRNQAQAYQREKELPADDSSLLDPLMKKFGILHFFRQLQVAERIEVFTLKK